jgi:hypothetical protein
MRSLILAFALVAAASTGTLAQEFTGNWECKAGEAQAGLLTIYGPSYIYASPVFKDPASGSGGVTGYSDGVTFNDGPLVSALGLAAGRLVPVADGRVQMNLESETAVVLTCFAI